MGKPALSGVPALNGAPAPNGEPSLGEASLMWGLA